MVYKFYPYILVVIRYYDIRFDYKSLHIYLQYTNNKP